MLEELIDEEHLKLATKRQRVAGGRLIDHLSELTGVDQTKLERFRQTPPRLPRRIKETGLSLQFLLNLLLKHLFVSDNETAPDLSREIKLPAGMVEQLLEHLKKQKLAEVAGPMGSGLMIFRYRLTELGKDRARSALAQSEYVGPTPVPLSAFAEQVGKQEIANERISPSRVKDALAHLVLPDNLIDQLGAAVNSAKAILLYGPSGNGKTSVAEALGDTFFQNIYLPHSIEVDSQVIKLFDPAVHQEAPEATQSSEASAEFDEVDQVDRRWVLCRRPVVVSGGELSLRMLDLDFNPTARYYEAPLQLKATGGIYLIDDFGRQLVQPLDLVNRWIVPLERRIDFLTLHTGKKFRVPFDSIVIFSTNVPPRELLDDAMLRRIQYKVEVGIPSREEYVEIFERVARLNGLDSDLEDQVETIMRAYRSRNEPLAAYHPKFLVEHVMAASKYRGIAPTLDRSVLEEAFQNVFLTENGSGDS